MAQPGSAPLPQGQFMTSPGFAPSPSAMNTSFGSIQVQTPPPTRGTSAKKVQQGQQIAFGTPSTIASRRFTTPQHVLPSNGPAPFAQQSPMQFPQLQFSPDINQFVNLGAASAPVMPQSRMLWEQNGHRQPVPQTALDDPFAPNMGHPNPWSPMPGQQSSHVQQVSFDTPAMDSFPLQAFQPRPASAAPAQPATTGVNPSLLYSSPIKPTPRPTSRQSKARPSTVQGNANAQTSHGPAHSRTDTVSSGSTVASRIDAPLQRSNTVGASRPKSAHFSSAASESFSRSNSVHHIPRTASPVKRQGRQPLGSISEGRPRQRTSVILTIDENGRARTETRRVEDSPTRSMRERYPALFDSDSSDDESDTSEQTPSKVASFTFDQRDARKAKAARLDPPVENLEGLSIPRSSSSASMRKGVAPSRAAVAAAAQLRRQGSLRKSSSSRHSQSRRSSAVIDSAPMDTFKQSTGGAETQQSFDGGLHLAGRGDEYNAPSESMESMLAAHNRRWSMMSFEQQQQPATQTGPMIRCLCGVPNDRGLPLIQCRSCTQWAHAACVENQQPATFTCFLCTPPVAAGAMSRG